MYNGVRFTRHLYQTYEEGKPIALLDKDVGIIITAIPKFAQQISSKVVEMLATKAHKDVMKNP